MTVKDTEVLIIGAGPSGLIAAREAAQRGTNVLVLEEHAEIGCPCHCAGLLSLNGIKKLNVPVDGSFVQNKVRGAFFFSPSGSSFKVESRRPVACVVDRILFDRFLARQALKSGAEIKLGCAARYVHLKGNGVSVESEKHTFKADVVIDAEGVSSRIVKAVGLEPLDPAHLLPGLQLDLIGINVDPDYVEVHVGRKIAPSFFAWVIPLSEESARVGLGCKGINPKDLLDKFINKRFKDEKYKVLAVRSGTIVVSGPIKKTFTDRFLVVGDTAGQVKPTTGGGVIFGGICAAIAGRITTEAVKHNRFEGEFLSRYEQAWRKELDREFRYMLWARRIFNALSDRAIDKIFELIIREDLQRFVSEEGDMDFQSNIISELLRRRKIFKLLLPLFKIAQSIKLRDNSGMV